MWWTWDPGKNEVNRGFETARLVFDDLLAATRKDPTPDEERWQTIGLIGEVAVIVVHTWPATDHLTGLQVGRIISARKATASERRAYEAGQYE